MRPLLLLLLLLFVDLIILKSWCSGPFPSISARPHWHCSSVYLLPSYTSFAAATDSQPALVCFSNIRFRDLITSHQSQSQLSSEVPFAVSHKFFFHKPKIFFTPAFFPTLQPPAHRERHNRPTDAEEGEHSFVVCFVCPATKPARIRFRLASSRLRNCPSGAIHLLSNSGGPFEEAWLGKGVWVTTVSCPCKCRLVRLCRLRIPPNPWVYGFNDHEHPRPFEYRHPPLLS